MEGPDSLGDPSGGSWRLERGALLASGGGARFELWAPRAEAAEIVLLPASGEEDVCVHPMEPAGGGVWRAAVAGVAPGREYWIRLDGRLDRADPVSRYQPRGVHGPSRVVDPGAFAWTDEGWPGVEPADLVLYELHVGTFTETGDFAGVVRRLARLADLGVTGIELMPVAQFPGRRNWGYDGAHPYAPQGSYGGPEGLRHLVDAAHRAGVAVLLDVVYNHLGPEGAHLEDFGPYLSPSHRTPWGPAMNFDRPGSEEVRRYVIDNALHWVTEYHLDGLRLDAVQTIRDGSGTHVLEALGEAVHRQAAALGRRVLVIAESDENDPSLVRAPAEGGLGLDALWSDDFHHAVHAALTGERTGYYVDFGGTEPVARALERRFVLDGRYSDYRGREHGASAADVPADRFVVYLQNHDQVGNRPGGERLDVLVDFEARKLAAALLLLSPHVPLLFMGEEYGEERPFLYFVDHSEEALREAVRRGRAREAAAFGWEAGIADPGDPRVFERSRPDPTVRGEPRHAALERLYRELLRLRRAEAALRPGAGEIRVHHDAGSRRIDLRYLPAAGGRPAQGRELFAAFNFRGRACRAPLPTPGDRAEPGDPARPREAAESADRGLSAECPGAWEILLSTAAAAFRKDATAGEAGRTTVARRAAESVQVPPRTAVLLGRTLKSRPPARGRRGPNRSPSGSRPGSGRGR